MLQWPFIRIFGLQEPASVLFSFLNFFAHYTMYQKFRKTVRFPSPMTSIWTFFALVNILNSIKLDFKHYSWIKIYFQITQCGWFWSMIFHARDTPFTEVMDYTCAFIIVLTLFYCISLR